MRIAYLTCLAAFAAAPTQFAGAQAQYPVKPVRVIVNVTPGGGVDNVARIAAQHYHAVWGQPFVVDNRTGAGGSIGVELVAKAAPDGYTLLVSSSGVVTNAAIRPLGYDPVRDLAPVTILTSAPYLLLTTPSLPVSNIKDLIALAKAKPGGVSFASAGTGSIIHMTAELLVTLSRTRMLHVPYKGVADAYPAVVSGDVNWIIGAPVSSLPLVRAGRLKAIAVTSGTRSKLLPDLPTVAEGGVAGYDVRGWFGMFAPAGTPPAIISMLNAEAKRAFQAPDVTRRMTAQATDIVVNSPQEFAAEVKAEFQKWRDLVRKIGTKF
ncbi:MAG: tripartite tricarboxylate transporter substrate binding protein [Betaproteobacteria bacterium]|nr:tripartite tricarboxylate transporter substrate binding protein [Betaproteobacteria bacterium]